MELEDMIKDKQDAQANYCFSHGLPDFTPASGICWHCHRQIWAYITLECAGSKMVTGCPCCNISFCE